MPSKLWDNIFKYVVKCYALFTSSKIDQILKEALNYNKAEKFIKIALKLCIPSQPIVELLEANDDIGISCDDDVRSLQQIMLSITEKVITWINISDQFYSESQKSQFKSDLQTALIETYTKCGWVFDLKILLSEELSNVSIFAPMDIDETVDEVGSDDADSPEDIDPKIRQSIDQLKMFDSDQLNGVNGNVEAELKKCCKYFLATPFTGISLLKSINESVFARQIPMKKRYKRLMIECMISNDFLDNHWCLVTADDEKHPQSELKRNFLDFIIGCIETSSHHKALFYSKVHPLQLLSFYGASRSLSDQKIYYLIRSPIL